jgi:hypothetical protein
MPAALIRGRNGFGVAEGQHERRRVVTKRKIKQVRLLG